MTIGFDASRAFIDKKTGTENYSYQLLKNLLKIDRTNNYTIYLRPPIDIESVKNDLKSYKNTYFKKLDLPIFWTQVGLALQTFLDAEVDVLFIPSHTLPILRKPGLKTVITVHDLGAEFLPQTHQAKQRMYLKMMTYYQLKTTTHIIAVSKATKKDIVEKVGIKEDKITVVYEGFDKNLFKPVKLLTALPTLKRYNLQSNNYFLFVGTVQPRKNLKRLIEAYKLFLIKTNRSEMSAELPKLAIAGSKGWLSDEIYTLPKELGIDEYVNFLGYVPDEDLPKLYSGAIAFLFPSLFEGFGLPILEAMACGCPILTSNTSSMPEVAGDAAILVDPSSIESIAQGIVDLVDGDLPARNEGTRKKLIEKGFKQVQKFSWEKCAKETLEVLKLCLKTTDKEY